MIETPWRRKAKALCAEMCADAWRTSRDNPRNPKRNKSPGYAVPAEASILIDALNRNDEQSAKAMFHRLAIIGVVDRP